MRNKCTDHLGNEFVSKNEMYRHYGISYSTAKGREKLEWTLEEILTTPVEKFVYDHLGNRFKSNNEMYRHYGITKGIAATRKKLGWSLEEILTTPIQDTTVFDHLGNKFKSEEEMYNHYGIRSSTAFNRKEKGWSLEEILTTPTHEIVKDHIGNEFRTEYEMYNYWEIPVPTAQSRKILGWSLEEILTTPINARSLIPDPVTNRLHSLDEISKKYNIKAKTISLRYRIYKYPITRCLEISFIIRPNKINIYESKYNLTICKRIKKGKDVFECYIDKEDGTRTFKIMTYEMIDQYCLEQYKKLHNIAA